MAIFDTVYYVYILVFGAYISVKIACGNVDERCRKLLMLLCPLLLLLQGACLHFFGMDALWLIYPLITHLPIVLALMLSLKCRADTALVSVIISYSLCQIPRWVGLVVQGIPMAALAVTLLHLALSHLLLLLLDKYCLTALHELIAGKKYLLTGFGALPIIYYLFDYFRVYTGGRFAGLDVINELLPTGLVLFFLIFALAYRRENARRQSAEQNSVALEMRLSHARQEISMLRAIEEQTAIHRHDLHHHLRMISSLLAADKKDQAAEYIQTVTRAIESVVPERFCENETVNLLLGAFKRRAGEQQVDFRVQAALPPELKISDAELCALISNGLENAVRAAAAAGDRYVEVYCALKQNQLLIEIKNPCEADLPMRNGMPAAAASPQHCGCRSMQSIVRRHNGLCSFEAQNGIFMLRIAMPL